jgi:cytochrome c1
MKLLLFGNPTTKPDCRKRQRFTWRLQTWIRNPQQVSPGTAMPDLNFGAEDARDITAFLCTRAN